MAPLQRRVLVVGTTPDYVEILRTRHPGAAAFLTPQGQVQFFGGATTGGSITNSTEWYYF